MLRLHREAHARELIRLRATKRETRRLRIAAEDALKFQKKEARLTLRISKAEEKKAGKLLKREARLISRIDKAEAKEVEKALQKEARLPLRTSEKEKNLQPTNLPKKQTLQTAFSVKKHTKRGALGARILKRELVFVGKNETTTNPKKVQTQKVGSNQVSSERDNAKLESLK